MDINLIIGGVVTASPGTLSESVGINGFLAEKLGHIFVGTLLVAAEIQKLVAVADNTFPLLFKQGF